MPRPAPTVHVLRIQLAEIQPPIWREVRVPSDTTLARLHDVVQVVFPWLDSHLHEYQVGKMRLTNQHFEKGDLPAGDESKFTLSDVAPHVGSRFTYTYDLGDCWVHEITVKGVRPVGKGEPLVQCLAGARASPPEDCGGASGYERLLFQVAHPNHAEHDLATTWLRGFREEAAPYDERFRAPFDPEAFEVEAANKALAGMGRRGRSRR